MVGHQQILTLVMAAQVSLLTLPEPELLMVVAAGVE
jgi:hypothetical protein